MKSPVRLTAGNYYGTEGAAEQLGVTTGRIRQLVRSGELKAVLISPHVWVFPENVVRRFVRSKPGPKPKAARRRRSSAA